MFLNRFMACTVVFAIVTNPFFGVAHAQESLAGEDLPIIAGPSLSDDSLATYARVHHRVTYTDYFDSQRPGESNSDQLRMNVERAQRDWLSGARDKARASLEAVSKLSLEADWRGSQREALHYAHIRRAQITETALEREQWLERAAALFPDLNPDSALFPPDLIEAFQRSKAQMTSQGRTVELARIFPSYRSVFINGKKFAATLTISLPPGLHRVTAVSDRSPSIHWQLTAKDLASRSARESFFVSGSCDDPKLNEVPTKLATMSIAVLFREDCLRVANSNGWQESTLQPRIPKAYLPAEAKSESAFPRHPQVENTSSRTLLWMGIGGAIATAIVTAVVINTKKSHSSPEPASSPTAAAQSDVIKPKHREGF